MARADWFREAPADRGIASCIPARKGRNVAATHDPVLHRQRHRIETMFARLKDWRRVATRYGRCADTYLSAIVLAAALAAAVRFWPKERVPSVGG